MALRGWCLSGRAGDHQCYGGLACCYLKIYSLGRERSNAELQTIPQII